MDGAGQQRRILQGCRRLLEVRRGHPSFHPDAPQQVWPKATPQLPGVLRTSLDGRERLLSAANLADRPRNFSVEGFTRDLISGKAIRPGFRLQPFQAAWLIE